MVDRRGVCRWRNPTWKFGGVASSLACGGVVSRRGNARRIEGMNDLLPVISATALTKTYQRGRETVRALDGVSFEIARGEFVAITGPSGAGKTTLLNLIGCMDVPTSGTLKISGREVQELN